MKKLIFVFAVFIFNFSNGQNKIENDEFRDWENPKNFEKFGLKKATSYSIKINKKGKIKRDSLVLSEHNYNKTNSEIFGISHYFVVTSHAGTYLDFYNFKNNYSKEGLILKKAKSIISKTIKNKNEHKFDINLEIFEYDSLKRKTKETTCIESNRISLYIKDTLSYFKSVDYPKITEYEYDSKNRIIKKFFTRDSTVSFYKNKYQKEFKISKKCYSCEEKYLDEEWNYDNDNLTKHINYTYQKSVQTKKYYYYNSTNQLIRKIDSSGFYLAKPYLNSITEFDYNNEKIETTTNFDDFTRELSDKEIVKYDLQNRIKSINYESNYIENNNEAKYEYLENSTIILKEYKKDKTLIKEVFLFDKRGLLIEKKEYYNEFLTEFIKYYYE